MKSQNNITTTMNDFVKHLPDPKNSSSPAIFADFNVGGNPVKLIAQKVKGQSGLTWKISSILPPRMK